jgi:hypothetical protein
MHLSGSVRGGVGISVSATRAGRSVYVGADMGEFGGGLERVDLDTGIVTELPTNDLRHTPSAAQEDPVTGLIADPKNQDCVIASVGLVHMFMSNGRILRVCPSGITILYQIPISSSNRDTGNQRMTEAFFSLAPSPKEGFWATTQRAIYHFTSSGSKAEEYPYPTLGTLLSIRLSKAIPGILVLRTDLNWAFSTSGYTPLIVPLEDESK